MSFTEENFVSTFFSLERKIIGPDAERLLIVLVLAWAKPEQNISELRFTPPALYNPFIWVHFVHLPVLKSFLVAQEHAMSINV